MTEKLEAVILDWAGTTMDYGCYAPAVVFMKVFADMEVPITIEEARVPMGAHKKVHIRKITELTSVRERWLHKHGREPTEADVETMFTNFIPAQLACLAKYAELIPGTLNALAEFRKKGLKIGSTTGYTGEMMKLLLEEAEKRGYTPDVSVCATGHFAVRNENSLAFGQVQGLGRDWNTGRPKPHMCNLNLILLDIPKPHLSVKVGDTLPDIKEGLDAGMWTIGLAMTGNEMGLTEEEVKKLNPNDFQKKIEAARNRMHEAGAHFVVDGITEVPKIIDVINQRLMQGLRP